MNEENMLFPGSDFGIPILDVSMQADAVTLPFMVWGQMSRKANTNGTYCFYTRDYKFSALWKNPFSLCSSGATVAVEVNYSTSDMLPEAVVIYNTFKKRWLSRYWQSNGVYIIVDLNVDPRWQDINMIGVPDGWSSFATRAHRGKNADIEKMYVSAEKKCGGTPRLFVVYGGGVGIGEMCKSYGWIWIPERMSGIHQNGGK